MTTASLRVRWCTLGTHIPRWAGSCPSFPPWPPASQPPSPSRLRRLSSVRDGWHLLPYPAWAPETTSFADVTRTYSALFHGQASRDQLPLSTRNLGDEGLLEVKGTPRCIGIERTKFAGLELAARSPSPLDFIPSASRQMWRPVDVFHSHREGPLPRKVSTSTGRGRGALARRPESRKPYRKRETVGEGWGGAVRGWAWIVSQRCTPGEEACCIDVACPSLRRALWRYDPRRLQSSAQYPYRWTCRTRHSMS